MLNSTVLVITDPADRYLKYLEKLPVGASLAAGNTVEAFQNAAGDADVILLWGGSMNVFQQVFRQAERLRWVHSRAAGLDGVLFPALVQSPVTLTNGRGVFSQSLGEFALASVLYFAKDLRRMVRNQMAGRWEQFDVDEISAQTAGIVGYGDIGQACAKRFKAMGMRVLAVRRRPELSAGDPNVDEVCGFDGLESMLCECDYVVAAAPLTPQTKSMISTAQLRAMKPSAILINIGRGPVVDEPALIQALDSGTIRGAALDVFDTEPLPDGHPYYRMEQVLLSPHCADHTRDWLDQAMLFFLNNFQRYASGQPLLNIVDKANGY